MKKVNVTVFLLLLTAILFYMVPINADDKKPLGTGKHHFGIVCNPNNNDFKNPEKVTSQLKELGVKLAICQLSWKDVEVEKGKFSEEGWKAYDEIVQKLTSGGIDIMCIVSAIPQWAKKGAGAGKEEKKGEKITDPSDLVTFLSIASGRYKDKIRYWALFNSPQSDKHWFEPKHFVELYRVGSKAIKDVDPCNVIVLAGFEGILDKRGAYLEKFLKLGGGKYVDMYDFHMNLGGGAHFSAAASETNGLKEILKRYNEQGKPIQYGAIATPNRSETDKNAIEKLKAKGWKPIDFERITPELQAIRLVTLMIWGRTLGVERIFWTRTRDHAPESGSDYESWVSRKKKRKPSMKAERGFNKNMGVLNYEYGTKPSFHAFKTLIKKLDTATFLKELNVGEDAKAFIFQREGKNIAVFWSWEGEKSITLRIDAKNVNVSDLYGKTVNPIDLKKGKLTLRLTPTVIYVEGDFKELVTF